MKRAVAVIAALLPAAVYGQTSAYQSADSKTSIFLANAKGNFLFNASDTKFDFGYLREKSGKSWLYGFDISGKPSSDFSTLFKKDKTPPDMGGAVSLGRHQLFSKDLIDQDPKGHLRDDWALVQFTYSRSSFQTVANASTAPVQHHFDSYKVLAVENALVSVPKAALLLGVGAGVERTNNLTQLKAVTISTPVLQSSAGLTPFTVSSDKNGYYGNYQQYIGAPIYSDAIILPKTQNPWISRLGIDLFTRSDAARTNRSFAGGVGLFVSKQNQPTQVLGGLSVAWKDGSPSVGFVVGFAY